MSISRIQTCFALGLAVLAGTAAIADDGVQAGGQPAPAGTTPPPEPTLILLKNGKVLHGQILEDTAGYVLKHKVGTIRFPRRDVEGAFVSLEDAYKHKLEQTPNDADERMDLAIWCLEQKLSPEAKEQLQAVLALSPAHRRAKAMLFNLAAIAGKPAPKDKALIRTNSKARESIEDGPEADLPPDELPLGALREAAERYPKGGGPPIIFELPVPLAVRRYQEFVRAVHPVLQRRCARCHNEQASSEFQLVMARTKQEFSDETILRANLDATLRLVDPEDLTHSTVLISAGMSHGKNGGRPILGGPNHPEFRVLSTWVNSLQVQPPASDASRPSGDPKAGAALPREPFAAGRNTVTKPVPPPASDQFPPIPDTASAGRGRNSGTTQKRANNVTRVNDNGRLVEYNAEPRAAGGIIPGSANRGPAPDLPDSQFPTSPLLGGPGGAPVQQANRLATPRSRTSDGQAAPGQVVPPSSDDPNAPPMMRLPDGTMAPVVTRDVLRKPAAPAKKPTVDKNALDTFIRNRGPRK